MNGTTEAYTQIGSLIVLFGILVTHMKYTNSKIEKYREKMYSDLTPQTLCDERSKRIEQKLDTVIDLLKRNGIRK